MKAPAYGYSTYILGEKQMISKPAPDFPVDWRTEKNESFILENNCVKVVFDAREMSMISFLDKTNGKEMVDPQKPAGIFRLIEEDDVKGMTAWAVGRYMNITGLNRNVKVNHCHTDKNDLRQWIHYETEFNHSRLKVVISLDYNSPKLDFNVECDWRETGRKGGYVPQLGFYMPLSYKCRAYKYDIPFGTIERGSRDMDVPANSWALGMPEENGSGAVMVVTNSKYGFRGVNDSISVALIRSSYDPDPYPENSIHKFKLAVILTGEPDNAELIRRAYDYTHPLSFVSGYRHVGVLPPAAGFMSLENGSVAVSAVKMPEEPDTGNNRIIIRVYEVSGSKTQAVFKFRREVSKAWYMDINENKVDNGLNIITEGSSVKFDVEAGCLATVCVELQ